MSESREAMGVDPDSVNSTILLTDRLQLLPAHPGAADDLFDLLRGSRGRAVTDNLLWDGPSSLADVVQWGETGAAASYADFGHHWSIHDLDGRYAGAAGKAMGAIGIMPSAHNARGDFGYWLGTPYWRQGLMSEAVEAVVTHAFTSMAMAKLDAGVFPWNVGSQRLLIRAGFEREGYVRSAYLKRGALVDSVVFGLTVERWRAIAA